MDNSTILTRRLASACILLLAVTMLGTTALAQTTYTWSGGAGPATWATAGNWTPTRTTPATNDIIVITSSAVITGLPTETIGQLLIQGSGTYAALVSAGAVTLTIGGGTGTDFSIDAGATLVDSASVSANAITVSLSTGATGSVSGTMALRGTGAGVSPAHKLLAVDASGVTFNSGSVFYAGGPVAASGITSNAFGTTNLNSIVFASGSTFIFINGSNPFGAGQPSSVVVFQTGSLYKHQSSGTPSLGGRTYANFELNFAATVSGTGATGLTVQDITVTDGTLNLNMTVLPINIKGNISVASTKTLTFTPAANGIVAFNGTTAQSISGAGTLTFAANARVVMNNAAGVTLNRAITVSESLYVTSGTLDPNGNTITGGSATDTLYVGAAGTIKVPASTFAGSFASWEKVNLVAGSTVEYNSASTQTIDNLLSYDNLSCTGGGTKQMNGSTTVANNLSIASGTDVRNTSGTGVTLTMIGSTVTVDGTITGTDIGAGNDMTLVAGTNTLVTGGGSLCRFLNVSVPSGKQLTVARTIETKYGAVSIAGTLQMNGGVFMDLQGGATLSYAAGGALVYNTGGSYGVNNEWPSSSGPTNVTIQNTTTVDMPSSDRTALGDLTISTGTLALNASTGDLKVGGHWTRGASGIFTPNNRAVWFNGGSTQDLTVSGGGTETYNYLLIDKSAGNLRLATGTNLAVNATTGDVLQFLNAGGLDLNGNTFTLSGNGGNILVSGGERVITGSSINITGTKTVTSASGGTLRLGSSTITTLTAGVDFGASLTTIDGKLVIGSGGFVNTNAPTYSTGAMLQYTGGGVYGRGKEWSAGSGPGYPYDVQISNSTTLDMGANGGTFFLRIIANDLTIDAASELTMNGSGNEMTNAVVIRGDIQNSGTITLSSNSGGNLHVRGNYSQSSTFNSNGRLFIFDGTGAQSLSATGGMTLGSLFVVFDSDLTLLNDVTINGVLTVYGQIYTGSQKVILGPTGSLGELGNGAIVFGTVEASRTISSTGVNETFGNVGMELIADSGPVPGATTVTRTTGTAPIGSGNEGIKRYYDISAATSTGLNSTMVFHYDDATAELNNNVEGTLSLYRSTNTGSTWLTTGSPTLDGTNNKITLAGVTDFSRWAAADAAHPLVTAASTTSDVVAVAASEPATISSLENDATVTTTADGAQVWQVRVQDGGTSAPDADGFPTELIAMTLTAGTGNQVTNWSNAIQDAALFNGSTLLDNGAVGTASIVFTGFSASATDNDSLDLSVRISLKNPLGAGVADDQHFVFEVTNANVTAGNALTSSQFGSFSAATSNSSSNQIDVAATKLVYTTHPPVSVTTNTNFSSAVTARDANGNTDLGYATGVTLALASGTGALSATSTLTHTPSSGIASWSDLQYNTAEAGITIEASSGILVKDTSDAFTATAPTSTLSDIVAVASSEAATISSLENTVGPLTSVQGVQVWQLTLRDGGTSSPDADALPTELVAMQLNQGAGNTVPNWSNAILSVDLFDGSTHVDTGVIGSTFIQFNTVNASAPDNGSKTFTMRLSLKNPLGSGVADNQNFVFELASGNAVSGNPATSSAFASFPTLTSSASDNKIDVVATLLAFTTQPATGQGTNANIGPVTVTARDANGNTDIGFANGVMLSSGTFTLASTDVGGLTQTPASGVASWVNLSSSTAGTGTVLANATGVSQGTSSTITVLGATVTSAATGNWNVGATWVGGSVPTPIQGAIIATGHTVTLTANDTCAAATVNGGGVLDISTFKLGLAGAYTLQSGSEGRQGAFNPVPGGGGTPWAFHAASTYTVYGAATGFSIGVAPGITFGNMNWNSGSNGTPPVGTVIAGNLTLGGLGEMRCGTGATSSRTVTVLGNVTINSGTLVTSNSTSPITGALDVTGDLTINATGTLRGVNFSGAGTILIGGNLINNGGTIAVGDGAGDTGNWLIYFKGTNTVTFDPGNTSAFRNIGIPAGKTVNLLDSMVVNSTYTMADSGTLNCGSNIISGAGNFSMVSGATLGIGSVDGITTSPTATGNVQVTGTRTYPSAATYVYNKIGAQYTGNGLPSPVSNVTITASTLTLTQSTTILSTLALGSANLETGAFVLTIDPASGLITRTIGRIVGNLQKTITVAIANIVGSPKTLGTAAGSATFEIGDASAYTPVFIEGTGYSGDFSVTASTTTGEHPDVANSSIDAAKSVNRYYTLTGTPTGPSDVTFNFDAGDVDGGANTANFIVGKYDSPTWTSPTVGLKTATSTQATGVASFSEFAIGEMAPPDVTFRVDMRPKMLDGFFEPDTDFVEVRGSFNGWSAGDTLADGDADSIYTKTLTLAPNTSFDYKFYKSPRGLYGWEDDISNRNVMTGTADTVLPAPFFNDQDFSVPVTFQVNMSVKMMEGTFRPDLSDQVDVRGNFNGWTGSIPMTDGDNDSIYTVALTIGSSTTIQYKFFKTLRGGIDWEGIPNRSFAIPSNTPSTIPSDYFDKDSVANIPAFLASPSSIPFGSVEVADSLKDTVFVYNTGLASMNISSITSDNPTFTLTPNSGTLAQGESLLVCVFFIPDSAQGETGNIVFTHDASTSPDTVTVSGMGFVLTPMYFLTLTPDSVFSENPVKPGKSNKPVKRQKGLYPNWSNLVDEVNAQGGFAPGTSESDSAGGMLIGSSYMFNAGGAGPLAKWKPVKDSASVYCWVRLAKWDFKKSIGKSFAKIQSTLYKKGIGFHTGPAGGLDSIDLKFKRLTKQLTKLDPKKHSNKLYAELVALKVNIAASAMGKTPAGLGDLLFDVNGNFLDEMSLIEISNKADSMMTFWEGYSQDDFDSLHSAVYNINRAFVGPLDTVTFETTSIPFPDGKLTVAGQVDLNTVTFLKAPVPFVATRIAALNGEVESPEGFEDEEFEDEEGSAPVAAKLYQNYPNPFNPSTTIAFNLRETSLVTVKIYNLLGQEMVTLLSNEDMDEGFQTVQFSAEQLSSGVYFYRIEAQGQDDTSLKTIETRKMVLLK